MVKDITTSQLDFFLLEEVSDRAAETISGGVAGTTNSPDLVDTDDIAGVFGIPGETVMAISDFLDFLGLGFLPELAPPAVGVLLEYFDGGGLSFLPTMGGGE